MLSHACCFPQTSGVCRHANHSAFGGIIPHFRRFPAIPRGICEIPLFHSIHLSHKNLGLKKILSPEAICEAQTAP